MASFDPAVSRLVERQLSSWEMARTQGLALPKTARPAMHDFLCLSRMVGVEAEPIAAELGRRLGWPVFDRQLLDGMAGDDRTRRRLYATMDERDLGWAETILRPLLHGMGRRDDYFHRLVDLVLALVRQAPAVFVGRGIDLVLPRELGFRVRLTAGVEHRRRTLARLLGVAESAAGDELVRVEREREQYLQRHFHHAAGDPSRFDLALNVERWTPQAAVELIVGAHERHHKAA